MKPRLHPVRQANVNHAYYVARYERSIVEGMAITGRSESVIRRGYARIIRLSEASTSSSFWQLQREWRRRVTHDEWGQRGRLRRLGIAI